MKKKVLVVDLDGTLYSINTFRYFIKYILRNSVNRYDIVLLMKVLLTMASRLFNIISHSKMKYNILNAIKEKDYIGYQKFVSSISFSKRSIPLINDKDFDIKILATAAPSCYANIIAKNEGFNLCLGTEFSDRSFSDKFENIREVKKKNVMHYLSKKGIHEIDVFITDHIDDLPLIKLTKKNIIINPSELMKKELKQNLISFEVLK